jgi:hypothetical protein
MRNIRFDESSVLQEFADIMAKKGLVKSASNVASQELERMAKFVASQRAKNVSDASIKTQLDQMIAAFKAKYRTADPVQLSNFEAQAKKLVEHSTLADATTVQTADDAVSKHAAKDVLYDVSGETGDKLVDEAHPDKAKIEGTDQIVENLTEQQKADLAVVSKKPTGKYSALRTELIALADKLDSMGLVKEANFVDGLLKKKADLTGPISSLPPSEELIQKLLVDAGSLFLDRLIEGISSSGRQDAKRFINKARGYRGRTLGDINKSLRPELQTYAKIFNTALASEDVVGLVAEVSNMRQRLGQKEITIPGLTIPVPERGEVVKKPHLAYNAKVAEFQKLYEQYSSQVLNRPVDLGKRRDGSNDGLLGGKTLQALKGITAKANPTVEEGIAAIQKFLAGRISNKNDAATSKTLVNFARNTVLMKQKGVKQMSDADEAQLTKSLSKLADDVVAFARNLPDENKWTAMELEMTARINTNFQKPQIDALIQRAKK